MPQVCQCVARVACIVLVVWNHPTCDISPFGMPICLPKSPLYCFESMCCMHFVLAIVHAFEFESLRCHLSGLLDLVLCVKTLFLVA